MIGQTTRLSQVHRLLVLTMRWSEAFAGSTLERPVFATAEILSWTWNNITKGPG